MKEIKEQLIELQIEDFIWIIFIFVSIAAIISDNYESKWLLNHDQKAHNSYKKINIILLIISFVVYLYFLLLSYKRYKKLHATGSIKDMFFSDIDLVAASLFLIGGLLNIYITLNTDVLDGDLFL